MPKLPNATTRSARLPLLAALILLLTACASGTSTSATASTASETAAASSAAASESAAATADVTVTLVGFEFTADDADTSGDVPTLTIPVGTSVAFVNEDSARHSATNGTDGEADADPAFDFNLGSQGASETFTFDTAGEFGVTCTFHPAMNLTIIVE